MTLFLKIIDREQDATILQEVLMLSAAESAIILGAFNAIDTESSDLQKDPKFTLQIEKLRKPSRFVRINGHRITRTTADKLLASLARLRPYIADPQYELAIVSQDTMH